MNKLYRKKPVTIEAVQFTGHNFEEIEKFAGGNYRTFEDGEMVIETLEGNMHVSINDFIIKGVEGEFYPCKMGIFWKTYDELK